MPKTADMATAPSAEAFPPEATTAPAVKAKRETVAQWPTKKVTRTLRMANMLNGLCMMLTGILVLLVGFVNISFTNITVSSYVVFFGMMMMCLECNLGNLAPKFRRNFGFMFSFIGRAIFIVFSATMLFAMDYWIAFIVGGVTMLNGLFNGYLICVHPAFKTGELKAAGDPYGGYSGGEDEMLSYLKKRPDLANKATSAAVNLAASNPQAAASLFSAAAKGGAK